MVRMRTSPAARAARRRLGRACHRAFELGLAHLRAALDAKAPGLAHQLLARGLLAPAHLVGLLAERGARAGRKVLERLLLASAGLRSLDVAARGGALLGGRHG